ncbi:hypothetical protein [Salinisphaera sp.]|uniref:hypothetical protein n=1 Tax=Salinisphaera sp. TaxID=1914330 RepID=UPI002D79D279|nr:hypothetical protein [Salinisphaera sp.]HET7312932.1 hypothetical protein [Salinisphaera sp.]
MQSAEREHSAKSRWKSGHQVFIGLIQALTLALTGFDRAFANGRIREAKEHLVSASKLMGASIQAMRFAADFDPKDYHRVVRPSMPEKFSGLDALDHKLMVQQIRGMKDRLADLPPALQPDAAELERTVARAYDAHSHVCERFVGREMSLRENPHETPAPDVLLNFKTMRLDPFAPTDSVLRRTRNE